MNELSSKNGTTTLAANNRIEVTCISRYGLILYLNGKEYYLPYSKFPWFKDAKIEEIFQVEIKGKDRIRWEALDVDLNLSIIENPDKYPLTAK
jgi:hypothetical protein